MAAEKNISQHQERAIAALLTTRTIADAASAAGLGTRTVERWLADDPDFVEEYRAARRRVFEAAIGRAQAAADKAVETLERNLTCGKPHGEIRAALGLLSVSTKGVETLELEERIKALEGEEYGE